MKQHHEYKRYVPLVFLLPALLIVLSGCPFLLGGGGEPDPLETPTNVRAIAQTEYNRIVLSWSAVNGADSYQVEYWTDSTPTERQTTSNTQFSLASPNPGVRYYFHVQAVRGTESSSFSSQVTATFTPTTTSSDATLAGLTISAGSMSPTFSSTAVSYTVDVDNTVSAVSVTPTASDTGATIAVNGSSVASGQASAAISLTAGDATVVTVLVTAEDGTTTRTYTLTVTRATAPAIGNEGTASDPVVLTVGTTHSGMVDGYSYYSFGATTTGTHTITISGLSAAANLDIYLYDSLADLGGTGYEASGQGSGTDGETVSYDVPAVGTYYLAVGRWSGDAVTYSLLVEGPSGTDPITYAIGDTGPAGGTIFYVDTTNVYPGFDYLEAAPYYDNGVYGEMQGGGLWGPSDGLVTFSTSSAVGDGAANTATIVTEFDGYSTVYAADFCDQLVLNGYDDWFLPSVDELILMRDNLHNADPALGQLADAAYWSSTAQGQHNAFLVDFSSTGGAFEQAQGNSRWVRAIRAFSGPSSTGSLSGSIY